MRSAWNSEKPETKGSDVGLSAEMRARMVQSIGSVAKYLRDAWIGATFTVILMPLLRIVPDQVAGRSTLQLPESRLQDYVG